MLKSITQIKLLLLLWLFGGICYAAEEYQEPIQIESDQIYYDKKNSIVYANKNVVAKYNGQIIAADSIIYFRDTEEIIASGDVALTKEDGSIYFSDKIKFDQIHNNAIMLNFRARFGKTSVMVSRYAELISKNIVQLNDTVYSSCLISENNFIPNKALWQIRADSAVLDKQKENVFYDNVRIEIFDHTVLKIPYLVTPAPGAKSRSGLLLPDIRWSKVFGLNTRIPVYRKINNNTDFTFGLGIYQKLANVYDLEIRQRFRHGFYKLFSTLTYSTKYDKFGNTITGKKDVRGHYNFKGHYKFSHQYIGGLLTANSKMTMDPLKTYLKKYGFDHDDILRTDINYRDISNEHYLSIRNLIFQDLRPNTNNKTTAKITPQVTYIYEKELKKLAIKSNVLFDYTNLNRTQGINYNRFVSVFGVDKNFATDFGLLIKNHVSLRSDFYYWDLHPIKSQPVQARDNGFKARYHPEYVSEINLALQKIYRDTSIIIDPLIQITFSPKQSNSKIISNEDSQWPELSSSNIFVSNKYNGYDLLENGNRINYGFRSLIKNKYIKDMNITAGQIFRLSRKTNFNGTSGLDSRRSDYILKVGAMLNDRWNVNNGIRIDNNNFNINRNEFNLKYAAPNHNFNFFHFYTDNKLLKQLYEGNYNQELQVNTAFKIYNNWWINAYIKTKLGKSQVNHTTKMIADGVTFRNKNECLFFELGIKRDYMRLKDLKPSTTTTFKITIPTF